MSTVKIDRIEDLNVTEKYGALQSLTRRFVVSGLTRSDYRATLDALAATGIPVNGDALTGGTNLICSGRSVTMLDKDIALVDVQYEHYHSPGQNFDSPPVGVFTGELRVNIQQVNTDMDENGEQIVLSHTYPATDPDYAGQTKEQTGEIQVFVPQRTMMYQGIKQTETPWLIANQIVGRVNSVAFSGGAVRTWMCTGCTWKLHDATAYSNRYYMSFEFQYNEDTWDPTARFIDDRTDRPPKDLVEGTGYKTIQWHPEVNFENIIGTTLQGG